VTAARLLADIDAVLTGTGPHTGHTRRQIGGVVCCDCGARVVGHMTKPDTEGQNP
jgi:hypothetical protein